MSYFLLKENRGGGKFIHSNEKGNINLLMIILLIKLILKVILMILRENLNLTIQYGNHLYLVQKMLLFYLNL